MNFGTPRKNYAGLAFVAALHLIAAGIALKHSTVWITHGDPGVISVLPSQPLPPKTLQEPPPDIKNPPTQIPLILPPIPATRIEWEPERTVTPVAPLDAGDVREGAGRTGGGGGGNSEVPRHTPVTVAAVIEAAGCTKPAYPAAALRNGDEGTVTLAFLVGKDGRVLNAKVERTSGHRDLDRAALQGLAMCDFKPGTVDGIAQESWARMQYAWRLDD
jgi:periplasmic protein TonB